MSETNSQYKPKHGRSIARVSYDEVTALPIGSAAKAKRELDRAYAKFWRKRGMVPPQVFTGC